MRFKIASLIKIILLLTLVFLMLTLLLNSVSKSSNQIHFLEQNMQLTGELVSSSRPYYRKRRLLYI